jgi:membrane fusion protein, multidrug efflux system
MNDSRRKSGEPSKESNARGEEPRKESTPDADNSGHAESKAKHNYKFLWIFGAVLVLVGIGVLIYHITVGRYYVKTKDAYVNGDLVRLAPQVSGTVTEITTDQTQPVRRGQLLVRLDSHDTDVSLAQAKANLAQTVRDVVQLFEEEKRDEAAVAAQEAQLTLANQNLNRDKGLIHSHGVAQQDLERDEEARRNAEAAVRQARAALTATRAAIAGTQPQTHPRVLLAQANVRSSWLASNRTRVLAPVSGYMVRRTVQLGQQVSPATEMLAIAPLDNVWIDANFKETQLEQVRIGQPVEVTADVYGSSVKYHGTVLGLTPGTGQALAVLPPENATGNWIKIVQRLPVRIGLDPRELRDHPLFLGLSMTVEINVHDTSGAALSQRPAWPAGMQTDVYAAQDAGVEPEIHKILDENLKGIQAGSTPATAWTPQ